MLYDDLVGPQGTWLCHHGIKGMKWGVRRYQNEDGSLTDVGRKRFLISEGNTLSRKALRYKDLKGQKIDSSAYLRNKKKELLDKIPIKLSDGDRKRLQSLKKYSDEYNKIGKTVHAKLLKDKTISGMDEFDHKFSEEMYRIIGDDKFRKVKSYDAERFNICKKSIEDYTNRGIGVPNYRLIEGYSNMAYDQGLILDMMDRLDKQL